MTGHGWNALTQWNSLKAGTTNYSSFLFTLKVVLHENLLIETQKMQYATGRDAVDIFCVSIFWVAVVPARNASRAICLLGPLNGHPAQSRLRIIQPAEL